MKEPQRERSESVVDEGQREYVRKHMEDYMVTRDDGDGGGE